MPGIQIVGRDEQLQAVSSFLEEGARPGALLIQGDPGIGKTTLWRAGVEAALELSYGVLRAGPAEKESTFAYSVVSDLLADVPDEVIAGLPGPQRRGLEVALLLRDSGGSPPEQHTLGVALLGVLRALSASRPLVLAIDDVQWLDPSSTAMLEFAVRRLEDEHVALLLARRQGSGPDLATPEMAVPEERRHEIRVGPLSMGALHRLLRDRFGTTLARPVLSRVHEASGGNPFYAIELVRALEASGGWVRPGHPLPVPETLDAILRDRIDALPANVRQVLAAAAALRRPTESMLGDWPALEQASEAGLIELANDEVTFTHPLLASAAYGSITGAERRALHRRLAEVVSDPEERARHMALGADGPDEDVAGALAAAARRASARGAIGAAYELAELAVLLTPVSERARLLERRVDVAGYHLPAGELETAAAMLEGLVEELPAGGARADALLLLASAQQSFERCLELAESALEEAEGDDARIAKIECYVAELLIVQASDEALEHARAALESAERSGNPPILATALATVAWLETASAVEPTPGLLEQAVVLEEAQLQEGVYDSSSPSFALGMRLMFAGRLDEARARIQTRLDRARSLGDEPAVAAALMHQAELELRSGEWQLASRKAAEGYERAEQIGREQDMSGLLHVTGRLDAHLGRVEEARDAARRGIALSESCGDEVFLLLHLSVLGFLELSVGDPEAADRILRPLAARVASSALREPSIHEELPNAIEALVELGELEEARRLLADLQDRISRIESPWGAASAGRCEGLILAAEGELAAAVLALERALAVHEDLAQPFDLARTLLALGAIQRRTKKRGAAREALERALAIFEELGATLWAEKARSELARVGGRAAAGDQLTPTEQSVAELVAMGKSNKEVAAQLFITPRTVEGHLTRIYAKLGVRSRAELAHRMSVPTG